jgi:E3 ubiquitin-protein ligase UBR1
VPIGCRFHPPSSDSSNTPTQSTLKASFKRLETPGATDLLGESSSLPADLLDSMSRTISDALEFILDTLDYSPDECNVPETEKELLEQPSQDPTPKDLFAIVLWNDEKHAFSEVNRQLVETCGWTEEAAMSYTDRIDQEERGVVDVSPYNARLPDVAHGLARVDLVVSVESVRRAYDTFKEQIAAVLIEWLHDLTKCRLRQSTSVKSLQPSCFREGRKMAMLAVRTQTLRRCYDRSRTLRIWSGYSFIIHGYGRSLGWT